MEITLVEEIGLVLEHFPIFAENHKVPEHFTIQGAGVLGIDKSSAAFVTADDEDGRLCPRTELLLACCRWDHIRSLGCTSVISVVYVAQDRRTQDSGLRTSSGLRTQEIPRNIYQLISRAISGNLRAPLQSENVRAWPLRVA